MTIVVAQVSVPFLSVSMSVLVWFPVLYIFVNICIYLYVYMCVCILLNLSGHVNNFMFTYPALAPGQVISIIDLLTVKLHCNVVACTKCVVNVITTSSSTRCPCCDDAVNLEPRPVQPASDIIQCLRVKHAIGMYEQVTMTHTSAKGLEFLKSKWHQQ